MAQNLAVHGKSGNVGGVGHNSENLAQNLQKIRFIEVLTLKGFRTIFNI